MHGTAYVTLACGRRWLAEQRRGNVLSVIATNAETGSPYAVPSAMSKAGVLAMTRSPAVEWGGRGRSDEHTSELQPLIRPSYAVFCLIKKSRPSRACYRKSNRLTYSY